MCISVGTELVGRVHGSREGGQRAALRCSNKKIGRRLGDVYLYELRDRVRKLLRFGWSPVKSDVTPSSRECENEFRSLASFFPRRLYSRHNNGSSRGQGESSSRFSPSVEHNLTALCTDVPRASIEIPEFVHFVSLDVEQREVGVLKTWPWDKLKVGVWVVEETGREKGEIPLILKEKGYKHVPVKNQGVDGYYVNENVTYSEDLNEKPWRVHPEGSMGC